VPNELIVTNPDGYLIDAWSCDDLCAAERSSRCPGLTAALAGAPDR
jgi:hypothetical protein